MAGDPLRVLARGAVSDVSAGCWNSSGRTASTSSSCLGAPSSATTSTPTAGTAHRTVRRGGPAGRAGTSMSDVDTDARSPSSRRTGPHRRARAGRLRASGPGPAGRDGRHRHQDVPRRRRGAARRAWRSGTWGRTATRRRRPSRRGRGALTGGPPLRWHFVGQLQRNKAGSVARYADVVHSVDRVPLVRRARPALTQRAGRSTSSSRSASTRRPPARRGRGCRRAGRGRRRCRSRTARLRRRHGGGPAGGRPRRGVRPAAGGGERLRSDHPEATWVSAGMSGDLEAAIRHGATHLRVGSAVLGSRPSLR